MNIMKYFLEEYQLKDEKYKVAIEKLPPRKKGYFLNNQKYNNLLVINEDVIKNIYNGNIEEFMVIFHELNHFKVKYEIRIGEINEDIVRIIKEKLIRKSSQDPFNEIGSPKSIKHGYQYVNDDYYCDNYELYSEEIYVNLQSKRDFLTMLKKITNNELIQQEFTKIFDNYYENEIDSEIKKYNNHLRDFNSNFYFNSNYLNYEEAFDLLVTDNPNWLQYPQIAIEYYLDANNNVQKRNVEQLQELLNNSNDVKEIEYISLLINKNKSIKSTKK